MATSDDDLQKLSKAKLISLVQSIRRDSKDLASNSSNNALTIGSFENLLDKKLDQLQETFAKRIEFSEHQQKQENENLRKLIKQQDGAINQLKESVAKLLSSTKENVQLKQENKSIKKLLLNQQLQIENIEGENRACSFIVSGIIESDSQSNDERAVVNICSRIMSDANLNGVDENNIVSSNRLGKKQINGKPRAIKVTFNSKSCRDSILRHSGQLRSAADYKGVYINPDESPLTRKENARLRQKKKLLLNNKAEGDNIRLQRGVLLKNDSVIDRFDIKNQLEPKLD